MTATWYETPTYMWGTSSSLSDGVYKNVYTPNSFWLAPIFAANRVDRLRVTFRLLPGTFAAQQFWITARSGTSLIDSANVDSFSTPYTVVTVSPLNYTAGMSDFTINRAESQLSRYESTMGSMVYKIELLLTPFPVNLPVDIPAPTVRSHQPGNSYGSLPKPTALAREAPGGEFSLPEVEVIVATSSARHLSVLGPTVGSGQTVANGSAPASTGGGRSAHKATALIPTPAVKNTGARGYVLVPVPTARASIRRINRPNATVFIPPLSAGQYSGCSVNLPKFKSASTFAFVAIPVFRVDHATASMSRAGQNVAWVTNLAIDETTRWTNLPFLHMIRLGADNYGLGPHGLYKLDGVLTDDGEKVHATAWLNGTAFGPKDGEPDLSGFLKRVPNVYIGSNRDVQVTPFAKHRDAYQEVGVYRSRVGQKRVDLGKGVKGHYWSFKIENVNGGWMRIDGVTPVVVFTQRQI